MPAMRPRTTPTSDPMTNPGRERTRLAPTWGRSSPARSASVKWLAISTGLSTKSGWSSLEAICQSASVTRKNQSGSSRYGYRGAPRLCRGASEPWGVWGARDPLVVNQPAQVRQSVKVPPVRDGLADDPLNADLAQRRPHTGWVLGVRQRPHRGIALDEDMIVARVVDQPIPPAVELADHLQPDLQRLSIEPDLGGLGQLRLQGLHLSAPLIELLNVDVHATSGLTGQIR